MVLSFQAHLPLLSFAILPKLRQTPAIYKTSGNETSGQFMKYPKTPWDVMGCQNHLFGGPRGVTRRVWCFHRRGREP